MPFVPIMLENFGSITGDGEDAGKQEFLTWEECELVQPLGRAICQYWGV